MVINIVLEPCYRQKNFFQIGHFINTCTIVHVSMSDTYQTQRDTVLRHV